MRTTKLLLPLFCGLVLIACADRSPTSVAPSAQPAVIVDDATPVPLKFHAECGPFNFTPVGAPPERVSFNCTADISHLGPSLIYVDQNVDFEPPLSQIGEETITADNGDQLLITHVAVPEQMGADLATGRVWYGGAVAIHGGTGRFEGAKGTGTYGGAANIFLNTGYFDLSAMIQYAAAGRRHAQP